MELYKDILINLLSEYFMEVRFSDFEETLKEVVEMKCYQSLQKIKAIIEDDSLNDPECFMKIEEVICVFESIGSKGDSRHDFS